MYTWHFPVGSESEESASNAVGRPAFDPWWGKFLGEEHSYTFQHSCLENPMDRGAWRLQPMGSQRVGHDLVNSRCWPESPELLLAEPELWLRTPSSQAS